LWFFHVAKIAFSLKGYATSVVLFNFERRQYCSKMDLFTSATKEKFLTLSDISSGIKSAINAQFGERLLWIVAEISDLNIRKGHCYLSLVEKLPGNAAPVCELKGIVWANKFEKISATFKTETGTELVANTGILFQAYVRYDVKWGLNLIVEDIEPKYTIGLLQQERDRSVAKLKEEGIYSNNKKLQLSLAPLRVAAISAKDSRGYEDFLSKLEGNNYGYRFDVKLFSSLLQGDKAASEMVNRLIEIYNQIENFDVVVIVRGGGGAIDLNCFNDYKLARAVARFPLPVLTGIGHTTNISIVDEVAFADRITPTDAADFLVERTREFEILLESVGLRVQEAYIDKVITEQNKLQQIAGLLKIHTAQKIQEETYYLSGSAEQLKNITTRQLRENEIELISKSSSLQHLVKELFNAEREQLNSFTKVIRLSPLQILNIANIKLDQFEITTGLLNPINILKRGFTITQINGKAVRNSKNLNAGDLIKTTFYEGTIESEVR
jgi:exodeoxyribonuclease VII large subunit